MEHNRDSRNKLLYIWSNDLQQGCQDHIVRKRQALQQMGLRKLDMPMQKKEGEPQPYIKYNNSKWIKDLNLRYEACRRKQGKSFMTLHLTVIFLDMVPKVQAPKVKLERWDSIKPKSFCASEGKINRVKRQPTEGDKTSTNHVSDKGLIYRQYKELKLNKKIT